MYEYKMTEEIVRWVLDVHIRTNDMARRKWWIAFTNPTAGPWKSFKAKTDKGMKEVHRFGRSDYRPDLVLVCDDLRLTLTIEAKSECEKLTSERQMMKSVEALQDMCNVSRSLSDHPAWAQRSSYHCIPGFAWGETGMPLLEHNAVKTAYTAAAEVSGEPTLVNFGIAPDPNGRLHPKLYLSGDLPVSTDALAVSLGL